MKIEELGELGLIERIRKRLALNDSRVMVGAGDDCCALEPGPGGVVLATTDSFVEGVHFDLSYFSYHRVGTRALCAALSDIAAMAGEPICALVSLFLPRGFEVEAVDEIYKGLNEAADSYRVSISGGDVVRSPHLSLTVTVIGEVEKSSLTLRSGAKPGDSVCVSGSLGGAEAGLLALRSSLEVDEEIYRSHLCPVPRIEEAKILLESCRVNSMIDLSDGLATDMSHIAEESGVEAKLYRDRLPVSNEARVVAAVSGRDPLELALFGGEDFELLFTLPKDQVKAAIDSLKERVVVTEIGEITSGEQGVLLVTEERAQPLASAGYDHFRERRGEVSQVADMP